MFVLFSFSWSYADGSKDLYPSGTTGGRAFLYSNSYTGASGTTMGSWPFKTLGAHYAYVKAGETIHAASSAQGRGNGIIRLTAPNGTTVYESTRSNTTGQIGARKNELAGPSETGTVSGDKYSTFNRIVAAGQGGIWKIEFLPTGSTVSSSTPSVASIGGNGNWTQSVSSELISAWDVSVRNASGNAWIAGRVYTNVMNLHISNAQTTGYHGISYVLTKDGYVYKVNNNGNNGVGFTFFVNNNGFYDASSKEPIYKSLDKSTDISSEVHSPLIADEHGQITHKIFYTTPSADLPQSAAGAMPGASTWLKNTPQAPSVSDLKLQGVDGTGAFSQKGGYVKFNSNAQGRYTIEIEAGEGAMTPFTKRVLTGVSVAGSNSVLWDGKDGAGALLSNGVYPLKVSVELQGAEVHFPFIDMEINPNGMVLELTNGPNPSSNERFRVYWDDSDITEGAGNNSGDPSNPDNASVNGELSGPVGNSGINGHRWGQNYTNLNNGYGNNKSIDTWTYIKGDKVTITPKATIQVADLKISSISHNKTNTAVKVDDKVTFTVKVKNGESGDGNSDVTGAPFTFTLPTGFIPDPDETVVFASGNTACGSEAIALTYNSTTRKYSSTLNLPNGCEVTYTIPSRVTSASISGSNTAEATILRPKDVTDPDATNPDPNTPPTNPYFECNPSGGAVTCNNIKNTPIMVAPRSDLAVTKSISNNKPAIGDNVTFTISVVNNGPDAAADVKVTDKLPSGYTFVSATPLQGEYDATEGVWNIGSLSNGASVTLTVIGRVKPSSGAPNEYRNTATISNSGSDDPDPSNNTGTAEPEIPKYTLVKGAKLTTDNGTLGKADVDDVITYTFTVKNTGNVTLKNVTVSDPLANLSTISPASVASLAPGVSAT
ncbi:MAG: DUF11 domain-containing protein, partial [Sphingobacterium sp.]|nr:DUF11 domain-containing protein [Sphingobacterium sp.]